MKKKANPNPLPAHPVRGSRTGRPVMAALDLLGRRWALRVIWELRGGPLRFRELQSASSVAPSVLNTRISELREAALVELGSSGYTLTTLGRSLLVALEPLASWAEEWAWERSHER